ncbi:putative CST complex subunit CTC1, plant protein [Helianthus annuus]|nr:putative CST complex subunit CTC1, plant protein [Helianthus annuus]
MYFCGSALVWYSAMSRLIGGTVLISGMKKKIVFLREGKSLMMYVSTEKAIIHVSISVTGYGDGVGGGWVTMVMVAGCLQGRGK